MGIDVSGGMIVGANAEEVHCSVSYEEDGKEYFGKGNEIFEEFYEWREHHDIDTYSYYFDTGLENQVAGFLVGDVNVLSPDFDKWCEEVKVLGHKFKDLTGIEPRLIGMQDVY